MKKIIVPCLVLLLCTSCTVQVKTVYDPKVDFSGYKTFCWLKGCEFTFSGPPYMKEKVVEEMMQNAIINVMKEKNIRYDNDMPDLLMDVHVIVKEDLTYVYHLPNDQMVVLLSGPEEVLMLKGTLVIDLVDKKTSAVVWRSVAISYMERNPDLTEANFKRGLRRALKKFPPNLAKVSGFK